MTAIAGFLFWAIGPVALFGNTFDRTGDQVEGWEVPVEAWNLFPQTPQIVIVAEYCGLVMRA